MCPFPILHSKVKQCLFFFFLNQNTEEHIPKYGNGFKTKHGKFILGYIKLHANDVPQGLNFGDKMAI